jgi:hypothetical protein
MTEVAKLEPLLKQLQRLLADQEFVDSCQPELLRQLELFELALAEQ